MVQKLLIYPDDRINCTSTDVRIFNQTLWDIIEDMKDTMKEHNLSALSAIQIAYPYSIIIIKQDDDYLELINPRILSQSGKFDSVETTSYYPDVEVTVTRDENLKIVYEDRDGKQKHLDVSDKKLAATIQRKVDYSFGGNVLDKVSKNRKDQILEALAGKGLMPQADDVCPTFSRKDYFVSVTNKLLVIMGLTLLSVFFNFEEKTLSTLHTIDKALFPTIIIIMISFFFYAQYEAKKYSSCSSCQIGNNIGVMVKRIGLGFVFFVASYFVIG
jgi:peptide deformylase